MTTTRPGPIESLYQSYDELDEAVAVETEALEALRWHEAHVSWLYDTSGDEGTPAGDARIEAIVAAETAVETAKAILAEASADVAEAASVVDPIERRMGI